MSAIHLAVKVDVCTHAGLKRGVPALMHLFDEFNIRASFFVSCGPDHSGRAIRRLLRPGFLTKMRRTNAVSMYGWRTILYGTLLPGPQIARAFPGTLRALVSAGHEVGMHGYDHVYWQDRLPGLSAAAVRAEIERGRAAFRDVLGVEPRAFGAPGMAVHAGELRGRGWRQLRLSQRHARVRRVHPRDGRTALPHARDPDDHADAG